MEQGRGWGEGRQQALAELKFFWMGGGIPSTSAGHMWPPTATRCASSLGGALSDCHLVPPPSPRSYSGCAPSSASAHGYGEMRVCLSQPPPSPFPSLSLPCSTGTRTRRALRLPFSAPPSPPLPRPTLSLPRSVGTWTWRALPPMRRTCARCWPPSTASCTRCASLTGREGGGEGVHRRLMRQQWEGREG